MNSVCHQGLYNVTNSFANSLWLADRFGRMANRGTILMARQSLIGFNYSLLGNFPAEPIKPAPDYFTTVLFKQVVGASALNVTVHSQDSDKLSVYAFCSQKYEGGVTILAINFDSTQRADLRLPGLQGYHRDYLVSNCGQFSFFFF